MRLNKSPKGLLRCLLRAPLWLFRLRLDFLLGHRFLMLTHTGRKTGFTRQAVIEVVAHDKLAGTYTVASGWGEKSDWFRNVQKNPKVAVAVAGRRFDALARRLPVQEAQRALWDYARRNPVAFRELAGFMLGERLAPTEDSCFRLVQSIPLILLQPVE